MANIGPAVKMIRGNTKAWKVLCKQSSGEAMHLVDGDKVYLTVKKKATDTAKALQVVCTSFIEGVAEIRLKPEDTKDLETGKYVYDIKIHSINGSVLSTPAGDFVLIQEVTYE